MEKKENSSILRNVLVLLFVIAILGGIFVMTLLSLRGPDLDSFVEYQAEMDAEIAAYSEISSIIPDQGIYDTNPNARGPHLLICKCTTSSGEEVWLCVETIDYRTYVDPDAEFGSYYYFTDPGETPQTIKFSPAVRFYGTTVEAESICEGLSEITGEVILEISRIDREKQ